MVFAGIAVVDTPLVRDAVELARSCSEPYLFSHAMGSWLFGVLFAAGAKTARDPELLAVSAILHDLGLTDRNSVQELFEVDGANAARSFLKERGVPAHQIQLARDAIALHSTRSIALHKELEVAMTHSGIAVDVSGAGLDRIPEDKARAILAEFPRLSMKKHFQERLCSLVRQKTAATTTSAGYRCAVCRRLHGADLRRVPRKCAFRRMIRFATDRRPKPLTTQCSPRNEMANREKDQSV